MRDYCSSWDIASITHWIFEHNIGERQISRPGYFKIAGWFSSRFHVWLLNDAMQPGIALLTAFMSRADQLKHEESHLHTPKEDWGKW